MWAVVFKESGVIAVRFMEKVNATYWAWINNLDSEGNNTGLFVVKKI
jgi:hypothetical protein